MNKHKKPFYKLPDKALRYPYDYNKQKSNAVDHHNDDLIQTLSEEVLKLQHDISHLNEQIKQCQDQYNNLINEPVMSIEQGQRIIESINNEATDKINRLKEKAMIHVEKIYQLSDHAIDIREDAIAKTQFVSKCCNGEFDKSVIPAAFNIYYLAKQYKKENQDEKY